MKFRPYHKIILLAAFSAIGLPHLWYSTYIPKLALPAFKPWTAIGGCGVGGSGGTAGDGFKWIGQGVDGGLLDLEVMSKLNVWQDFNVFTISPRFSFRPTWSSRLGVSLPLVSKSGAVQYRTNQVPVDRTTGGSGDLAIDFMKSFGSSGQYSVNFSTTFPTGQYDIKRGPDASQEFLPANLQKGSGIYSASLGLDYTKDQETGLWLGSIIFNAPFNISPTGKNSFLDNQGGDSYLRDYRARTRDSRFYYNFKPYGEGDLGDFTPPSILTSLYYGYRGQPHFVHSFGMVFSAPLGVSWIRSEKINVYNPRPDPDHQAWTAAFVYGMEFSRDQYPFFLTFSIPLHDKTSSDPNDEWNESPMQKWNLPEGSDFLQQWNIGVGIKATLF